MMKLSAEQSRSTNSELQEKYHEMMVCLRSQNIDRSLSIVHRQQYITLYIQFNVHVVVILT